MFSATRQRQHSLARLRTSGLATRRSCSFCSSWGAFLVTFGASILISRLAGWSWDRIWRHYLAWLVILYAAMVGFNVAFDVWTTIYNHVPHVLLLGAFVGWLALWALRLHVRYPAPRRRP